jgi:dihydrofolate reductase
MPKQDEHLTFTFVTDGLASAVAQAKAAARDRDVQAIGGISVVQQLLRTGLADELHIDLMPVVLGAGRRLFEDLDGLRLEKIDVTETGTRTSLRFRVRKG